MSKKCYLLCFIVLALAFLPAIAHAITLGTAQLMNVTTSGGCVYGPTGATVQAWDIEPGHTYTIRISNVTECGNGGTDPTLNVRLNSSIPGYEYNDLIAVYVSPGVYQFDFFLPPSAWCTLPICYCTTPGDITTGFFVRRNDGGIRQAHLRASRFESVGMGCTNPMPIIGPECGTLGTDDSSWGTIKAIYK